MITEYASTNDMAPTIWATCHKQAQYGLFIDKYIKIIPSPHTRYGFDAGLYAMLFEVARMSLFLLSIRYWYRLHETRFYAYVFYRHFSVYILCLLFKLCVSVMIYASILVRNDENKDYQSINHYTYAPRHCLSSSQFVHISTQQRQ